MMTVFMPTDPAHVMPSARGCVCGPRALARMGIIDGKHAEPF